MSVTGMAMSCTQSHAGVPAVRGLPANTRGKKKSMSTSAGQRRTLQIIPSARRLVSSLRDMGYDFTTAVADIVDNSVAAHARTVRIDIQFDGNDSRVLIA